MKSYLSDRHQRVCVNKNVTSREKIITGVSQDAILGPLLFKSFINDLFLFVPSTPSRNYTDDNTLYVSGSKLEEVEKTS